MEVTPVGGSITWVFQAYNTVGAYDDGKALRLQREGLRRAQSLYTITELNEIHAALVSLKDLETLSVGTLFDVAGAVLKIEEATKEFSAIREAGIKRIQKASESGRQALVDEVNTKLDELGAKTSKLSAKDLPALTREQVCPEAAGKSADESAKVVTKTKLGTVTALLKHGLIKA